MDTGQLQLEPIWKDTPSGSRISFLCEIVVWGGDNSQHLVKSALDKRFIKVVGNIPNSVAFTFLDVIWDGGSQSIRVDDNSHVLPHQTVQVGSLTGVTELCAGLGAMSIGIETAGGSIKVKNDLRDNFISFLNREGFQQTVCGDINDSATLKDIHSCHPESSILTAWFSCQPWSKLGDKRKLEDRRSGSLVGALQAGFLLRSHAILLECVGESGKDPQVIAMIKSFCAKTGFWYTDVTLRLDHVWPSKRERWWCLIVNPTIPKFTLPPLPSFKQSPSVGQLLPVFPAWPDSEMQQLIIDEYEYGCFSNFSGIPNVVIDLNKPLATALHGWGNQLMGCPCGCRSGPLSLMRLKEKGLWGALLPLPWNFKVQGQTVVACRHIHPWELAILTGCDAERPWGPQLKLSLCGLGQQASPFHSGWIMSHLVNHIHEVYDTPKPLSPFEVLWEIASRAFVSRDRILPDLSEHPIASEFVSAFRALVTSHHQANTIPSSIQAVEEKQVVIVPNSDDAIPTTATPEDELSGFSGIKEDVDIPQDPIQDDGYTDHNWDCPYDDCFICISMGLKPPVDTIRDEDLLAALTSGSHGDITPTVPFTIEAEPVVEPNTRVFENNLLGHHLRNEQDTLKVHPAPTFSMVGGHFAFASSKEILDQVSPDVPIPAVESKSEESLDLGPRDIDSEPTPKRQRVEEGEKRARCDQPSDEKDPSVVRIQLPDDPLPHFLRIQRGTTFREISIALKDLLQISGSLRLVDTLGQLLQLRDWPHPFQHFVAHSSTKHTISDCYDSCQPSVWFPANESCPRIQMLFKQESWVAKDEMDFYLGLLASSGLSKGKSSLVFDDLPDQFEQWLDQLCHQCVSSHQPAVSAILMEQHWIPFAVLPSGDDGFRILTSKEGDDLARYCQVTKLVKSIPMPHLFKSDCGFQTIGWLVRILVDPSSSHGPRHFGDLFPPITPAAAASWRFMFEHHLFVTGKASEIVVPASIRIGGVKEFLEAQLHKTCSTNMQCRGINANFVQIPSSKS